MANKLELTWHGKEQEISVEPRLLTENPEFSNTENAPDTENMLIHGDNLLALKALEYKYAGLVKCIYIDNKYLTLIQFNFSSCNGAGVAKMGRKIKKCKHKEKNTFSIFKNVFFICKQIIKRHGTYAQFLTLKFMHLYKIWICATFIIKIACFFVI